MKKAKRFPTRSAVSVSLLSFLCLSTATSGMVVKAPSFRQETRLVSHLEYKEQNYLGFPAVVKSETGTYWISYKRGFAHGADDEALLEAVEWNPKTGSLTGRRDSVGESDIVYQMGEWIRFPNGRLLTAIDAQNTTSTGRNYRVGLRTIPFDEATGKFGKPGRLGEVNGIEYGYLFDTANVGDTLYALVMTFEDLAGGRRTVDVIRTTDNGQQWTFVRNLSEEFGDIRINESSLLPYKDGFLVATRGYDSRQRIHRVRKDFSLIEQKDLTQANRFIETHIGRPRLFEQDGAYYLIGRNYRANRETAEMEMALFGIDPETFTILTYHILDNLEWGRVTDGYYPSPFFTGTGDNRMLNVIDYKAIFNQPPDIWHFDFKWNDLTQPRE